MLTFADRVNEALTERAQSFGRHNRTRQLAFNAAEECVRGYLENAQEAWTLEGREVGMIEEIRHGALALIDSFDAAILARDESDRLAGFPIVRVVGGENRVPFLRALVAEYCALARLTAVPRRSRGAPPGSGEIDDSAHLKEMETLILSGSAKSVYDAACQVARKADGNSTPAIVDRLRRKYRKAGMPVNVSPARP